MIGAEFISFGFLFFLKGNERITKEYGIRSSNFTVNSSSLRTGLFVSVVMMFCPVQKEISSPVSERTTTGFLTDS
jgi:hypothetical protein